MDQYIRWISTVHIPMPSGYYRAFRREIGLLKLEQILWNENPLETLGSIAFGCNMTLLAELEDHSGRTRRHCFTETYWETSRTLGESMVGTGVLRQSKCCEATPVDYLL